MQPSCPMKRSRLPVLFALALLLLALAGCGSSSTAVDGGKAASPASAKAAAKALKGSPPQLAALHAQANQLLGGGADAFKQRLAKLKGNPVVVNKWASWCASCRAEFPLFRSQSIKRGKQIAFLGVDSSDNDANARKFLSANPVTYPSYKDGDLEIAQVFRGARAFPTTVFYDSKGKIAYLKQGGYPSQQKLAADIDRYAR